MASVKVAVRVRPFNQREQDMDAKLIIQMDGKKTRILNTKITNGKDGDFGRERYKDFTFDHSYWSFDASDPHFSSQEQVYSDLGTDVIKSAFEGYNACVFAYGQTGSGKTFTMMGSPENQGLIPRICETLFSRMSAGKEQGTSYRTEVSYLEIYNETVKDLLRSSSAFNLKVREHPKQGPYVQDLSKHLVSDYSDIKELMIRGNNQRTTASTNMNDVSSRSHAIFTIMFVQAGFSNGMPSETVSKVHLVDLAGSERADTSGATGQRLKEGAHINKSLVTLGLVISALAELSSSETRTSRTTFIPYRDSVLTWLLRDSLGGNSKTIMIAAVSPADCNYGETLSTLRYANRAKNIINKPTINEDPHVKLIRELRDEITKLRSLLGNEGPVTSQPHVLAELHQKVEREKVLTEEWAEKWRETQKILQEQKALGLRKSGLGVVLDSDMPHLVGIDDNVLSTGVTLYHLKEGETFIGTENATLEQDIVLDGIGVESEHCSVVLKDGVATLIPKHQSQCWVNSILVDKPTRLSQGCIIVLGRNIMFRYNDPAEAAKLRKEGSRSHLSLSCLSLLSRSELTLSNENLGTSSEDLDQSGDLELKKLNLLKEKEAFKKEQAEREQDWEREQQQKLEELVAAQKELEVERLQMEHEYEEQRKRLAEDWQRLEKQQQDSLTTLHQKEIELQRRKQVLELERQEELALIDEEVKIVTSLKSELEKKEKLFNWFLANHLTTDKLIQLKLMGMENKGYQRGEDFPHTDSSPESWASLSLETGNNMEQIQDSVSSHQKELVILEGELKSREQLLSEHRDKVEKINIELNKLNSSLQTGSAEFEDMKRSLAQRTQEQLQEILLRKQSMSLNLKQSAKPASLSVDENSIHCSVPATLSSSVGTADTFHTATSPCSGDEEYGKKSNYSTSSFEKISPPTEIHNAQKLSNSYCNKIYPINPLNASEAVQALCDKVAQQKSLIISSLASDNFNSSDLNRQIAKKEEHWSASQKVLQELKRQYIKVEMAIEQQPLHMDNVASSEESDDLSTSADDGLSENLSDVIKSDSSSILDESSSRRSSLNLHPRILQSRLDSPRNPAVYSSNASQENDNHLKVNVSIPASISESCSSWVEIPSYVLRGAGSSTHYEYDIHINIGGDRWTLLRRYRRFRELHFAMKYKYGPKVEALPFPPRRFFSKNSESVARLRRRDLEHYLRLLFEVCSLMENCPLSSCRQNPSKLAMLEFSSFFRKGVFETSKYGTS